MHDDTIAAIATPTGSGGIGVIRVSGPDSRDILNSIFVPHSKKSRPTPYLLRVGHLIDSHKEILDEVMTVFMPGPKSYTGEDLVEIYCHAGAVVLRTILNRVLQLNCRPAEAGEFSQRRFVNSGEDLSRLEGAADIVAAKTDLAYRLSREHLIGNYGTYINNIRHNIVRLLAEIEADIDFPDEDSVGTIGRKMLHKQLDSIIEELSALNDSYRTGRIIRDGYRVILLGAPNVGKSSLFNKLIKHTRSLVTPIPGTTRDYISEWIDIDGLPVELYDTAGLRTGRGQIEKAGIALSKKIISKADLILYIEDINNRPKPLAKLNLKKHQQMITVLNKADICKALKSSELAWVKKLDSSPLCVISARTGRGIKSLLREIHKLAGVSDLTESIVVTSERHKKKIDSCLIHLKNIRKIIDMPAEIVSLELRQAADTIGEITGHIYTEQILDEIFANFCIGK
ncbi:MAG: tRNA uridine-5-carboxymethylaminomethyl(34) synthesis GTPase MnmE [candidate division Zixibacteria bacterium]|nr:tRNA uridine-5-carboxymethylaminomethyl(34) synthesis GTPase MnmE [candidate division Zixibacteria bacterium]